MSLILTILAIEKQNTYTQYNPKSNECSIWRKGLKNDMPSEGESRPYRKAVTYETEYDKNMTVEEAYNWLKTQEVFEGAEDI